jgi:multidrug efflux pump subunit AcrB
MLYYSLLKRPRFIVFFTLFLALWGGITAFQLPVSLYPNIDKPTVRVTMFFEQDTRGFYHNWGKKIELSLNAIKNSDRVEAKYSQGIVQYFVHFNWSAEQDTAKKSVETSISFYQSQLPKNLPQARVDFFDPSSENYVAVSSEKYSIEELSELLRNSLEPQLKEIEGVGATLVSSEKSPYISIELYPYKMLELGIKLDDVLEKLDANEYDLKLGDLKSNQYGSIGISFNKSFHTLEDLRSLTIKSLGGHVFRLQDIAEIINKNETSERMFLLGDKPIVAIAVWPEPNANLYEVSKQFQERVTSFVHDIGEVVIINNPKEFIENAILNIIYALVIGMVAAAFVITFFYSKFSIMLLIVITMPLSLFISFTVMKFLGVSINLLSLGAMGICIGMVIDCAVVVVDHLNKQFQSQKNIELLSYVKLLQPVISPIVVATLTSIAVFIPLVFTSPMTAAILSDLALVTISVLITSLLLSLFFIPVCFININIRQRVNMPAATTECVEYTQDNFLRKCISALYSYKKLAVLLCVTIFVACGYLNLNLINKLKTEIVAQPKAQIIDIDVRFKLDDLDKSTKKDIVESYREAIMSNFSDQLKHVYIDIRENNAYLSMHLKSYKDFDYIFNQLGVVIKKSVDADVDFSPWITSALNIKTPPTLNLSLFHQSENTNREIAKFIYDEAKQHPHVKNVKLSPDNRESKVIHVDFKPAIASLALSGEDYQGEIDSVMQYLKYSSGAHKIYDMHMDIGLTSVKVKYGPMPDELTSLAEYPVPVGKNKFFLGDLLELNYNQVPREIFSINGQSQFQVEMWFESNVTYQDIELFKSALKNKIMENYHLSTYPVMAKDEQVEVRDSLKSIQHAFIYSLIVVFLLILFQFENIYQSCIAISVIFFGVTGAIVALYVFDSTLSLNSLLGILILVGLTVNNSILLIEGYNREIHAGMTMVDAIVNSIQSRIRPLLVTNITTIVGMLPLAVGFGAGKDILKPLGISVSAGLLFSTLLTLFIIPVLLMFSRPRLRKGNRRYMV